jgi:hypothetical protein
MKISGAKYIGVQEQVSGTVIYIYKILPEGSRFLEEPATEKEVNGNDIYNGGKYSLEITSADMSKFSQLEAWMKNKNSIRAIITGYYTSLYWYEYTPFLVQRNFKVKAGEVNSFTMKLAFKGSTTNIYTT